MKIQSLYFSIFLFIGLNVFSQVTFQKSIPYSFEGMTLDLENTMDGGNVFLCRDKNSFSIGAYTNYCIKVYKTKSDGTIEWTSNLSLDLTSLDDGIIGYSIKQTRDSGYIITGTRFLKDSVFDMEYNNLFIVKIDATGNIVWNKCYAAQGVVESTFGIDVIQTSDENYVITGIKTINYVPKLFIAKVDSMGNLIWERTLHPLNLPYSYGYTVSETINGNLFVAGTTLIAGVTPNPFLIKVDANGNTIWGKTYNVNADRVLGIPTNDGGYIVLNTIISSSVDYLMKLDSLGDAVWCKQYPGNLNSVSLTDNSGFILSGGSSSFGTNTYSGFLIKTDSLGMVSFFKTINNLKSDFYSVKQAQDGGFIAVGERNIAVPEIIFVKTDSMGLSGCNDISLNPIVNPITLSDSSRYVVNMSTGFIITSTVTINVITDNADPATDLCLIHSLSEHNKKTELNVFPNPTNGELIINYQSASKVSKVQVINSIGEVILENNNSDNNLLLNISDQPNGIYILTLNQEGVFSSIKIVKE